MVSALFELRALSITLARLSLPVYRVWLVAGTSKYGAASMVRLTRGGVFCGGQEKYLKERIKVEGKAGDLGETVKVNTEKSKIVVQVGLSCLSMFLLPCVVEWVS